MTNKRSSIRLTLEERSEPYTFDERLSKSNKSSSAGSYKRVVPAVLASLVTVLGAIKLASSQSRRSAKENNYNFQEETTMAQDNFSKEFLDIPTVKDFTPEELQPTLSTHESTPSVPLPKLAPVKPPVISTNHTQDASSNSVSNQLFSQVSSVAPKGTTLIRLWQCVSLLQRLSTDEKGVCKAATMPRENFAHFVNSVLLIPPKEVDKAIQNSAADTPLYSFKSLSNALMSPTNAAGVAQEAFLLSRHYQAHYLLAKEVPAYEGYKSFIYWDRTENPTVGKGVNLKANPDVLSWLRVKNSWRLRALLPSLPKTKYVTLSAADLAVIEQDAKNRKFMHRGPNIFRRKYALSVHPDDLPKLDVYFHKKIARALNRAESDLEKNKPASLAQESVLFGSYQPDKQVPLSAVKVAHDIAYNTGNLSRSTWKKFAAAFEKRNFLAAKNECSVSGVQSSRNIWHKNSMQAAHDAWLARHPVQTREPPSRVSSRY